LSLLFTKSDKNKLPFEVLFDKGTKTQFFDLDTLKLEKNATEAKSLQDKINKLYWHNF